mmetsp:Transcript_29867/g.70403  ORF Transcript_29867/g.70403 Transcript_29867/m.70403 type:complete len:364 (+) Transcript_29867:293-1384(+)
MLHRGALCAALLLAALAPVSQAAPVRGTVTEVSSFSVSEAPSGMFHYEAQDLLYVLCGTQTNGAHTLYAMTTGGEELCEITIPEAAGMSRVDGFWIDADGGSAFIVDSQGPIYASEAGKLGGSVYEVEWSNPCGCGADATCAQSTATWNPTVTKNWALSATEPTIGDGGGNDEYFRNSGIVVVGDSIFAVNGVHPNPDLECCYPKSVVEFDMATAAVKSAGDAAVSRRWQFTAETLGHDVDMEGLTCGADSCENVLYIGDEYNFIYALNLTQSDPATAVGMEWNLGSIVGDVNEDKGIESLTYAKSTGYFYAGIQGSSTIHVVELTEDPCTGEACGAGATGVTVLGVVVTALLALALSTASVL